MTITLHKSILLRAAPTLVWDYLTLPDKIATWFHAPKAPLTEGGKLALYGAESGDMICWGEVRIARAPEYLEYIFTIKPMGDAVSTVKWALNPVAGGTQLVLEHADLPEGGAGFDLGLALDKGWENHMGQMRDEIIGLAA